MSSVDTLSRFFSENLYSKKEPLDRLLNTGFNPDCVRRDAVFFAKKTSKDFRYSMPSSRARNDLIQRWLGLIPYSEREASTREAIVSSYVFLKSDGNRDDSISTIVNASADDSREFVDALINQAKIEAANTVSEGAAQSATDNFFLLHGERGAGKTTWLTYVMAKHRHKFDQEKTVFLRVDPNDSIVAGSSESILRQIHVQMIRIFLRYYDPSSAFFEPSTSSSRVPFYKHLLEEIERQDTDNGLKIAHKTQLLMLKEILQKKGADQPLTLDAQTEYFGMLTKKIALAHGFNFVIALDGLDKLEITDSAARNFAVLKGELGRLIPKKNTGLVFLAICRKSSRRTLIELINSAYGRPHPREYEIQPVSLQQILEKRKSVIIDYVLGNADVKEYDTSDWPSHIEGFFDSIPQRKLSDLLGLNNRAQMQAVQILYQHYLVTEDGSGYHLIEKIMTMGEPFPPTHYTYIRRNASAFERHKEEALVFDNRFLPSIFNFPLGLTEDCYSQADLLLGLRICQFVYYGRRTKRGYITLHDLQALTDYFGYSQTLTQQLVEEYDGAEILSLEAIGDSPRGKEPGDSQFKLSPQPKLEWILAKGVSDIAYINLSAMRAPVDNRLLSSGIPLLKATSIGYDRRKKTINSWILTKLCNNLGMVMLVNGLSNRQRDEFLNKVKTTGTAPVTPLLEEIFSIAENFFSPIKKSEIMTQIDNMLGRDENRNANHLDLDILEKGLSDYFRTWFSS